MDAMKDKSGAFVGHKLVNCSCNVSGGRLINTDRENKLEANDGFAVFVSV
jgi:hypothetical protein